MEFFSSSTVMVCIFATRPWFCSCSMFNTCLIRSSLSIDGYRREASALNLAVILGGETRLTEEALRIFDEHNGHTLCMLQCYYLCHGSSPCAYGYILLCTVFVMVWKLLLLAVLN